MKRYYSLTLVILTATVFNAPIKSQFFEEKPLFEKYAGSAINEATLVERQGLKYQVNSSKPFSGKFMGFDDEYGFCVNKAGTYKKGLLHGEYEEYEGCGVAYSLKTKYKNGSENGRYEGYEEGYLFVEGNVVNGKLEGEWISYEYGQITFKEYYQKDTLLSIEEFSYYDSGQLEFMKTYNSDELQHGITVTYHQNGQLKEKVKYDNGNLIEIIEQYDFNGNPIN
tara:strand:+ start:492 stop:1163 length:672 start_codon:yes stop_codon:yes gene_type:complete